MQYSQRLQKARQGLNCDAVLIENPTDLLYLTGLELSKGKLLIGQNNAALVVDGRYIEKCRSQTLYPVLDLDQFKLKEWMNSRNYSSLGFDSDRTTHKEFLNLQKEEISLIPLTSPIMQLRLIKDADEIALLRASAHLAVEGSQHVISLLSEGISEEELAFDLEFFWKKKGAKKLAFDPIIAFGTNSSMPHYRAGTARLEKGMPVLIDIGVVYGHYHSDLTRVVFFGEPDERIKKIYPVVEEAKKLAMEMCKPGTLIGDLDKAARNFITEAGYGEYFTHSLGHGVGLDIHEAPLVKAKGPFADVPLEAGMVLTIEPGIYLPGVGGVRLEDTLLITDDGHEVLTVGD